MAACRIVALLTLAPLLAPEPGSRLAAQEAAAGLYRLDPDHSLLWVVTSRRGLLSFLGHDHALVAGDWGGTVCWDAADPWSATGTVSVATASLRIDDDSARALAGLGRSPSAGQLQAIQEKLLGPDNLDAAAHPRLALEVDRVVAADSAHLELDGRLTIRGVARPVRFTVALTLPDRDEDALRLTGGIRVRQTDYGIRPESVAGVVRVADPVDIRFDLLARWTGARCS
jgi:polyisoprenoid-binding protein YceI